MSRGTRSDRETRRPVPSTRLETELTRGVDFRTARVLRQQLRRYMRYYNRVRMHSALAYRSPLAFEARAA